MKKLAIIYSTYTPTIEAIKNYLQEVDVVCLSKEKALSSRDGFDLVAGLDVDDSFVDINVHHSLLPSFEGDFPVKQAFLEGVKVTGISFYYTNPKKIIAQYPLFIKASSHYDEILQEMQYLEQSLYPLILDKILKNECFEISKLVNGGCSNCGDCGKCTR